MQGNMQIKSTNKLDRLGCNVSHYFMGISNGLESDNSIYTFRVGLRHLTNYANKICNTN